MNTNHLSGLENLFDRKYTVYGNGPYSIGRASSECALFVVLQVQCLFSLWYRKFNVCSLCGTASSMCFLFLVPQVQCVFSSWYCKLNVCSLRDTASSVCVLFMVPQV